MNTSCSFTIQVHASPEHKTFSGSSDAVFILRPGATLRNVIIGKNQKEGVHCLGPCTLEFVWFEDVCEDAISIVSPFSMTAIYQDSESDIWIVERGCSW